MTILPDIQQRDNLKKYLNVSNLFYLNLRLKNFGNEENIPVYNLAEPDLCGVKLKKIGKCFHGFDNALPCGGHCNAEGHKLAGEIMANYFCNKYTISK